jgi:branched-subunit amino acid transport protein AzlD
MPLTGMQTFIIIIAVTAGTMLTRFLPFILFPEKKKPPELISYLGKTLPAAMMGLLIVYCLKGVSVTVAPFGIPELIAIAVIVGLHMWKNNTLLSIGGGTVVYMFLVQFVF